jgi:hypothetical protein
MGRLRILTAYQQPTPFERVIQALVYNVILRPFIIAVAGVLHVQISHWILKNSLSQHFGLR